MLLFFFASFGVSVNSNTFVVEGCDAALSLSEPTAAAVEPFCLEWCHGHLNTVSLLISRHNNSQETKDKVNRDGKDRKWRVTATLCSSPNCNYKLLQMQTTETKTNQDPDYKTVKEMISLEKLVRHRGPWRKVCGRPGESHQKKKKMNRSM